MASSLPEYKIYMDFKAGGYKKDTMLMNHLQEICEGLHQIFPDKSAQEFRRHILKGRKQKSRNYLLYPKRISYIEYKEVKKLRYSASANIRAASMNSASTSGRNLSVRWPCVHWETCIRHGTRSQEWSGAGV